jgi:hypothetical protein
VRGQDDRRAGGRKVAYQAADVPDPGGVQTVCRLVENEQLGTGQQRDRNAEALPHA